MSRKHPTPARIYRRRRILVALLLLIVIGAVFNVINGGTRDRVEKAIDTVQSAIPAFKDPCPDANPFSADFVASWATQNNAIDYQAVAYNPDTDCTYQIGSAAGKYQMASTIKVMIALAELERVTRGEVKLSKIKGDLTKMITISDNAATQRLWDNQNAKELTPAIATEFNLVNTDISKHWGISLSNAADQTLLFRQAILQRPTTIDEASWNFLRTLLSSVEPDQQWGAGFGLPAGWTPMVKNGWYHTAAGDDGPDNKSRVNTIGTAIDPTGKHRWVLSGYSNTWDTDAQGIAAWNALSTQVVSAWAN